MKNLKKIHSILNIFQEGVFEKFKIHNGDLNFKLECTFLADIIHQNYTSFYGVLKNCKDIYFKSWEEDVVIIDNLNELEELRLLMLNAEFDDFGYIKVYCNCSHTYKGGNLYIKADDIVVFTEDLEQIGLESLNELAEKYWYEVHGAENY